MDNKTMLTITAAARLLGVSRGTVALAIQQGQLKGFKLGRRVMIRSAEVAAILGPQAATAGDPLAIRSGAGPDDGKAVAK